jgi:parallel beta-helix repeat protein
MNPRIVYVTVLVAVLVVGCGRHGGQLPPGNAAESVEQQLLEQLRHAAPGSLIAIPLGTHPLQHTLTLHASGVTVRGTGTESSTLSFAGAAAGTAGLIVTGNDVRIENLSIEDTHGDGLVISGGRDVSVRGVRIAWNHPAAAAGADGIRAQGVHNLLLEDSAAYSAAGTGIALSQARNVIVRRCHVEQNSAGIALANTAAADVSASIATGNGVGLVVSSTAGVAPPGYAVRIFGNRIYKNNLTAATGAAAVPSGVGIALRAVSQVEIFDNDVAYNETANLLVGAGVAAPGFDAYPTAIFVHDNRFAGGGNAPGAEPFRALRAALGGGTGALPDIVWDGEVAAGAPSPGAAPQLCVRNGAAQVLNTDAAHAYHQPLVSAKPFRCQLPQLPAVTFAPAARPGS